MPSDGRPLRSNQRQDELDPGRPESGLPEQDFWEVLYGRRSIRRFKDDPVPEKLIDQVLHAGIWVPSSCNYQMWDVVAVTDPEVNATLAELSSQMGNAPTNLVVSYGRDFSEEGWANIQSASAMIQNMSLAAHALGLGTFWITQMGDREKVREVVGLPFDRLVIAVLALGYPAKLNAKAPGRRPLERVTHFNSYAGEAIPSSTDPRDWTPELLKIYQRARVLNGLRHNKPRAWEVRALEQMLASFVKDGQSKPEDESQELPRWLDVLPCNGIVTDRLSRERRGFAFDIVERSPEVGAFVSKRTRPKAGILAWPPEAATEHFESPAESTYDVVSCLFRLEDTPPDERKRLLSAMKSWLKPGGQLIIGYVSASSFHQSSERLRKRRGGPGGVEYVLSPDPNIGPFEALAPSSIEAMLEAEGIRVEQRLGLQAVPQPEEIEFRTRNFSGRSKQLVRTAGKLLSCLEKLPGYEKRRARFQFISARK